MEQTIGLNKLVLPVYYVSCDAIEDQANQDHLVAAIKKRNWNDWRAYRFMPFDRPEVRAGVAELATNIRTAMRELGAVAEASQTPPIAVPAKTAAEERKAASATVMARPLPVSPPSRGADGTATIP